MPESEDVVKPAGGARDEPPKRPESDSAPPDPGPEPGTSVELPRLAAPTVASIITNVAAPTLTGTAVPGATLVLTAAAWSAEVTVAGNGTWSALVGSLAEGQNDLSASQRLAGFLQSAAPHSVTIDTLAPGARHRQRVPADIHPETEAGAASGTDAGRSPTTFGRCHAGSARTDYRTGEGCADRLAQRKLIALPVATPAFCRHSQGDVKPSAGFVIVGGRESERFCGPSTLRAGSYMVVDPIDGTWRRGTITCSHMWTRSASRSASTRRSTSRSSSCVRPPSRA